MFSVAKQVLGEHTKNLFLRTFLRPMHDLQDAPVAALFMPSQSLKHRYIPELQIAPFYEPVAIVGGRPFAATTSSSLDVHALRAHR